jgi:K(+)-stimulated pyrophosphate-energized sodium pump
LGAEAFADRRAANPSKTRFRPNNGRGIVASREPRREVEMFTSKWFRGLVALIPVVMLAVAVMAPVPALATEGGEANLQLPDLGTVNFFGGTNGRTLLMVGLVVSALGLGFGLMMYTSLKNMPVHASMLEVSELIYETCKTYLIQQGKFLMILELFIGAIIFIYFFFLQHFSIARTAIILIFSLIGIAGSYGVAWFGIRINTFANSRTAFASLRGKPFPCYAIPLKAGMSIGMALISVELFIMLCILLFVPGAYAGPCFIGFAIGESLGAAALRIAGGIFTKIADIGADLMKVVFKIKEDDARNPGVIADCTGDNAGDSVGPSADGFETYGVTGVALISFILLAVQDPAVQVQLLVWIFTMRDNHIPLFIIPHRSITSHSNLPIYILLHHQTPLPNPLPFIIHYLLLLLYHLFFYNHSPIISTSPTYLPHHSLPHLSHSSLTIPSLLPYNPYF